MLQFAIAPREISSNNMLMKIKKHLEEETKFSYNSVLVNVYQDQNDFVAWHSDEERIFERYPTIASLSFGETRRFQFKSKLKSSSFKCLSGAEQDTVLE